MTEHNLKTWPAYFHQVKTGRKLFELRRLDRDFKVGDVLRLQNFDPMTGEYSGDECKRKIATIFQDKGFGLHYGFGILGLEDPRVSILQARNSTLEKENAQLRELLELRKSVSATYRERK